MALGIGLFSVTTTFAQNIETVKFSGNAAGVSTRYIDAVEGNINFAIKDLQDLGINTYRIYGGMSRWEPEDDGKYGWPEISQIKANANIINWAHWDKIMTDPPKVAIIGGRENPVKFGKPMPKLFLIVSNKQIFARW